MTLPKPALLLAAVIATGLPAQLRETTDQSPLTETERIRHLLSRFTFGPTPSTVEEVRQMGMDVWFDANVSAPNQIPEDEGLVEMLAALDSIDFSIAELIAAYNPKLPANPSLEERQRRNQMRNQPRRELRDAILYRAVFGRRQILEVASDFFRNHLNVDVNKGNVRFLATDYEREVIRASALGNFGTMLAASSKHPAMLIYLDNALSRRPMTKAELGAVGRRVRRRTGSESRAEESIEIARQRGLNENYARELLELHTLGVDN